MGIKIFSDKPRRIQNIYIAISFLISGVIAIITAIVIAIDFIHWSLWILIITGIVFILLGSYIFYRNKEVFGLDTLEKVGDMTSELYNATEKKLYRYLESNIGSAFTTKALLKRVVETINHPNFKKFAMKNGENILDKMVIDGKIQSARKNENTHYFIKRDN